MKKQIDEPMPIKEFEKILFLSLKGGAKYMVAKNMEMIDKINWYIPREKEKAIEMIANIIAISSIFFKDRKPLAVILSFLLILSISMSYKLFIITAGLSI